MKEIYYGVVIFLSIAKFIYDIITDIIDRHKSK